MKFEIKGYFKMGKTSHQKFRKEVEAKNKEFAKEKVYSIIGSKHRVKRRDIEIKDIKKA
ncbi:50S ribosomal protein L18a [archaeon SCG-AAA382B04]|nr:50S ribosomal protein L18a [archaeon SCG-AAA382B04]